MVHGVIQSWREESAQGVVSRVQTQAILSHLNSETERLERETERLKRQTSSMKSGTRPFG